jgi:hypothetical protein
MLRATLGLLAAALTAACSSSTGPDTAGVSVLASWGYVGRQTSPTDAALAGTLAFMSQAGASVAGALDVVETSAGGAQRRMAGAVSGRTVNSTTLDFDVTLTSVTRRHIGVVKGDSITGTWIEQPLGGGAPSASGSFRAARN